MDDVRTVRNPFARHTVFVFFLCDSILFLQEENKQKKELSCNNIKSDIVNTLLSLRWSKSVTYQHKNIGEKLLNHLVDEDPYKHSPILHFSHFVNNINMDERAAKLALARKKLKDHQTRKNQDTGTTKSCISPNSDKVTSNSNGLSGNSKSNYESYSTISNTDNDVVTNNIPSVEKIQHDTNRNSPSSNSHVNPNTTEILIFQKRSLEFENIDLKSKLSKLENDYTVVVQQYNSACQKVNQLDNELKNINIHYQQLHEQLVQKDNLIKELNDARNLISEEKDNLQEQMEFTKSVLLAKETENDSLNSQLYNIQSQLESAQLQLQQLSSGLNSINSNEPKTLDTLKCENEILQQKLSTLEQQLKQQIRDYQQANTHYENYVRELTNQLQNITKKNDELNKELQSLSNRESSLVEQISEMEIRLQHYSSMLSTNVEHASTSKINELEDNCKHLQEKLSELNVQHDELQKKYSESLAKIEELSQSRLETEHNQEVLSLSKLSADITSDKIAVQKATEQNKKLKQDIQGLEDAFVKMSKDKLELIEKLSAEKFLNQELTIKLAEIDDKAKDMQIKLKAKDDEMIRLQTSIRELERKYDELYESKTKHTEELVEEGIEHSCQNHNDGSETEALVQTPCSHNQSHQDRIPKDDAMLKLQERFLKIMGDVADLSDEKHRLEHIITQLQNETDTICEYVALYQQQRSLLKKRDEERNTQIKIYQSECKKLQSQLDELTGILTKFAEDQQLSSYFENQTKHEDIKKVMALLTNLKTNTIIDPENKMDFRTYYPCNCCSGKLIEV